MTHNTPTTAGALADSLVLHQPGLNLCPPTPCPFKPLCCSLATLFQVPDVGKLRSSKVHWGNLKCYRAQLPTQPLSGKAGNILNYQGKFCQRTFQILQRIPSAWPSDQCSPTTIPSSGATHNSSLGEGATPQKQPQVHLA